MSRFCHSCPCQISQKYPAAINAKLEDYVPKDRIVCQVENENDQQEGEIKN